MADKEIALVIKSVDKTGATFQLVQLKTLIAEYITYLEISPTIDVCKCEWKENFPVPGGQKVKVRGSVSFSCPVHTKEGMVYDFLKWINKEKGIPKLDLDFP